MTRPIPKARWSDSLRFNLFHVLPYYLLGIFRRRRGVARLFAALGVDPYQPRFFESLRIRYSSPRVLIRMLTKRTLLVLDAGTVARILDRSPAVYAEPELKRIGMSHFQPGALTISRGRAWKDRRDFNERVLDTDRRVHEFGAEWLRHVRESIGDSAPVHWSAFSGIFGELAQRVVFGGSGGAGEGAVRLLSDLMSEADRVFFLRHGAKLARLQRIVREAMHDAPDGSLLARCRRVPTGAMTDPALQVPHWLFAIAETLPANVIRALLLIASHPDVERRVAAEIGLADLRDPAAVDALAYLEAAIQESMRLWPTTPVLGRSMLRRDVFGDAVVAAGTEITIVNDFIHRDRQVAEDADRYSPDRWIEGRNIGAYNHFSNGKQVCAGRYMALFLAKAALALLLSRWRYLPTAPSIDANGPVPFANDYFSIRFRVEDRGVPGSDPDRTTRRAE